MSNHKNSGWQPLTKDQRFEGNEIALFDGEYVVHAVFKGGYWRGKGFQSDWDYGTTDGFLWMPLPEVKP